MQVIRTSREGYVATQIARSSSKFENCNVSSRDVIRYRDIVMKMSARKRDKNDVGPILCLGTRSGREVDLFRLEFFGGGLSRLLGRLERHKAHRGWVSLVPSVLSLGRSSLARLEGHSVIGVEINPKATRGDIWIGSFDEMPGSWTGAFGVLFSNSFDQAQDPERTAREWLRVLRDDGLLIFCYVEGVEPTLTDPVGNMDLRTITGLFGDDVVYFSDGGSASSYSELVIRKSAEL